MCLKCVCQRRNLSTNLRQPLFIIHEQLIGNRSRGVPVESVIQAGQVFRGAIDTHAPGLSGVNPTCTIDQGPPALCFEGRLDLRVGLQPPLTLSFEIFAFPAPEQLRGTVI